MAVTFEDYYQTLGVARDADADAIKRAYRKLARQHHPDVSKNDPDAAKKFAKIAEAYDVLSDPQKRKKYNQFGQNWKHGQSINPDDLRGYGFGSPGYARGFGGASERGGGFRFESSGGGFSDFFESIFGQMRDAHAAEEQHRPATPTLTEHQINVTLHEALHGGTRALSIEGPRGTQHVDVKVPAGVRTGSKIRLKEHGLLLVVRLTPHPDFQVQGDDLIADVTIDPATAALGGKADVPTADGKSATLTVPPGSSSGTKLRLRGQGLPRKPGPTHGPRGDLVARLMIRVPKELTPAQRAAYEALRDA